MKILLAIIILLAIGLLCYLKFNYEYRYRYYISYSWKADGGNGGFGSARMFTELKMEEKDTIYDITNSLNQELLKQFDNPNVIITNWKLLSKGWEKKEVLYP